VSPPAYDGTCGEDGDPTVAAPAGGPRRPCWGARILAYIVVLGVFLVVPGVVFGAFGLLFWLLYRR